MATQFTLLCHSLFSISHYSKLLCQRI